MFAGGVLDVFVDADLVGDEVEALGEPADLVGRTLLVLAERGQALRFIPGALADEVGLLADRGQGHAGGAQDDAGRQPVDIVLGVDAAAVRTIGSS